MTAFRIRQQKGLRPEMRSESGDEPGNSTAHSGSYKLTRPPSMLYKCDGVLQWNRILKDRFGNTIRSEAFSITTFLTSSSSYTAGSPIPCKYILQATQYAFALFTVKTKIRHSCWCGIRAIHGTTAVVESPKNTNCAQPPPRRFPMPPLYHYYPILCGGTRTTQEL